jgi:hypothetical protein
VDPSGLAAELAANVRDEVRFDDGTRALYAIDASNYRQVPIPATKPRPRAKSASRYTASGRRGTLRRDHDQVRDT